ncbi:MAG: NUDIX hydrolase [Lentisphaerales bacterium]|jgi:ADP-ribose pyrophosphatase|nr:MAG: NUDIX hydrolase [Lentisphaerales bacterium]
MQIWKTLSRRTVLEHSKFLTVEEHAVQLPDGRVISDWPWIITPDFVNILPITTDGTALVFRQPKYGVEGIVLAPVGGYLEPGEEPVATAKRELLEETGYEAPDWVKLGSYRVGGNRGIAMAHLFLAREAKRVQEPQKGDELEEQEEVQLSLQELETALTNGEFKVLAWAALVSLALRQLRPGS